MREPDLKSAWVSSSRTNSNSVLGHEDESLYNYVFITHKLHAGWKGEDVIPKSFQSAV